MKITVHTLPHCVQCDRTKLWLTRNDLTFGTNDLLLSPEELQDARDWADENGVDISAAPVVVVEDEHGDIVKVWTGYRLDLLPTLLTTVGA